MARRKGPVILVVCMALLLGALAGAVAYRAALLEAGLHGVLRARGVPGALTVRALGWSEATLEDIALGAGPEVRARRVRLAYDPADLVFGRLSEVEIEGPIVTLNATGAAPLFGSLQPLLDGPGSAEGESGAGAGGAAVPIPILRVTDARIEAATPLGPAVALLSGVLRPAGPDGLDLSLEVRLETDRGWAQGRLDAARAPDGRLSGAVMLADGALALPGAEIRGLRGDATFALRADGLESASAALSLGTLSLPGVAFERARLDLRLSQTEVLLEADLGTADGQLRLNATGRAQDLAARPSLAVQARAEVTAQAALWTVLGLPAPAAGRATATVSFESGLPAPLDWAGADLARLRGDLVAAARGHVTVDLDKVAYPGLVRGLSGQARLDAAPDPARPGALTGQVALDLTVAEASVAELRAEDVALRQRAGLRADPDAAILSTAEPGRLSARSLSYGDVLSSAAPIAAAIAAFDATIDRDGRAGTHALTLVPERIAATVHGAAERDLAIQAGAARVQVSGTFGADRGYAGSVLIEDADAAVPAYDVAVQGLDATLAVADGGLSRADFAARSLRHDADPPLIAPLSASGSVALRDDAILVEADASGPNGVGRIAVRGRHRPAAGAGDLELSLTPLEFSPGGAQPGDLVPGLGDLREVTGTARASARVAWTAEGVDGSAELAVETMSLTSAAARVEDLSLALRLDRLRPPASPPGQTLRIGLIDPGVPLTDLAVRFQVLPADPASLAIEAAQFVLAEGRFELADVVIDPSHDPQHLPIRVDSLDLAETFRLLGVEGLSGEGRLSGTLPIQVDGTAPSIRGGSLAADAPGLLRIRSDYAKQALAGAGESADLLLRALEDFHYEELTVTIDQPAENEARLGISMLGHNPNVLDGYPFRFNINLETDPRKLLAAVQEAYRISDRAIRNLWMFGR